MVNTNKYRKKVKNKTRKNKRNNSRKKNKKILQRGGGCGCGSSNSTRNGGGKTPHSSRVKAKVSPISPIIPVKTPHTSSLRLASKKSTSTSNRSSRSRSSTLPVVVSTQFKPEKTEKTEKKIEKFANSFFENLRLMKYPEALCELYKIYVGYPYDEVRSLLLSPSFNKKYETTFYTSKKITNSFGISFCGLVSKPSYVYFLAYIFKKVAEGGSISCDGKKLYFLYNRDKANPSILTIIKKFLGFLDGACFNTTSYTISAELYVQINNGTAQSPSKTDIALVEIVNSLKLLVGKFPSLQSILDNMTTLNSDGSIASYSINPTVLSNFIKQSYTDFLNPIYEYGNADEDEGV